MLNLVFSDKEEEKEEEAEEEEEEETTLFKGFQLHSINTYILNITCVDFLDKESREKKHAEIEKLIQDSTAINQLNVLKYDGRTIPAIFVPQNDERWFKIKYMQEENQIKEHSLDDEIRITNFITALTTVNNTVWEITDLDVKYEST